MIDAILNIAKKSCSLKVTEALFFIFIVENILLM